tara:strand:- start:835 stop:2598 length:1764 start_codon:yes stop_codon:yes gene_type:complete
MKSSILFNIKTLWNLSDFRRKFFFLSLTSIMILSAFTELITVITVMPFIASLTQNDLLTQYQIINNIIEFIGYEGNVLYLLALLLISIILLSSALRILTLYLSIKFAVSYGIELSNNTYKSTLLKDYIYHTKVNSSEIVSAIIDKVDAIIFHFIQGTLNLITASFMLIAILLALIIVDFKIAMFSAIILLSLYLLVTILVNSALKKTSQIVSFQQSNIIKNLNEGLNSIRDIILDNKQQFYVNQFSKQNTSLREVVGLQNLFHSAPRYFIEAILLCTAIGFVMFIFNNNNVELLDFLPAIGALVLGAQKLIPNIQMVYQTWVKMKGNNDSCTDVLKILLETPYHGSKNLGNSKIDFNQMIIFKNVNFSYSGNTPYDLVDLNLSISKGSIIGIYGQTGSGKSTFLDLLMGLLKPVSGKIIVDKNELSEENLIDWQSKISHVPQSIYLVDETFQSNIAFGENEKDIDFKKLETAISIANAKKFIETKEKGLLSIIGEKGLQISGGQRQRIGIARSVYRSFEILILDEATNALDEETEGKVINSIIQSNKNATIILLTHRISSLKRCDSIFCVSKNTINEVEYSEISKIK